MDWIAGLSGILSYPYSGILKYSDSGYRTRLHKQRFHKVRILRLKKHKKLLSGRKYMVLKFLLLQSLRRFRLHYHRPREHLNYLYRSRNDHQ